MIPFLDLSKTNAIYAEELKEAAAQIIDNGHFLQGEKTRLLEKQLSEKLNVKHVITCGNGLDALRIILKSYIILGKLQQGDHIILPGNTFIASALAITDCGMVPYPIDPDPLSFNLNTEELDAHLSEKTKAIMIVHLYGQCCWSSSVKEWAKKRNLLLIEDNAQSFSAKSVDGEYTGSLGDAAGFSFYPAKNLGALSDAGAISTNDDDLASVAKALTNYGSLHKYEHLYQGFNSRIDEVQSAFLSIKIRYIDQENEYRREIAQHYQQNIVHPEVILPHLQHQDPQSHVWHLFVIRSAQRDSLSQYLLEQGIQTGIHYPYPIHKHPCFADSSWAKRDDLPISEKLSKEVLALPMSPVLSFEEAEIVVNAINKFNR